ncbi:MAG: Gfo/Idh/MocA family oxidoreductase [Lachnospiraceae bacterium]|nr:Gfo/Idh/MocA family oxidoreductase [Lachnospiraceae bacterium]
MTDKKKIRLGVIGVGNMGSGHLKYVSDGLCPSVEITAVCDIRKERLETAKKLQPHAVPFTDALELMDSGLAEAVLIAVPHYLHPVYAKEAFSRGLHVLTEKPAGVTVSAVREMNKAARASGKKFAIMFNQRTNPLFIRAHDIVQSGLLGEPKRLVWIITNWYRTQAYYNSGSWRATWSGEGGGVLLNQAPHNLDIWQWIFGVPDRVHAAVDFGKYHHISVDDDATIIGEYDSGARAVFITTTGECPGTNRLEISGDRGKLVLENGTLKWWKLEKPEREICFTAQGGFYQAEPAYEEFSAAEPDGHPILLQDFAEAILEDKEVQVPGYEGIKSLSISNAAYLSAWTGRTVVPGTEDELFDALLEEHRKAEGSNSVTPETPSAVQKKAPEDLEELKKRWQVRW